MRAMVLRSPGSALEPVHRDARAPGPGEVAVRVVACGVCRTDLHVVDGELPDPKLPLVPGHEVVGRIAALGEGVAGFAKGNAKVSLSDKDGGTLLSYDVEAQIGGKLAQLGQRLINSAAKKTADDFFVKFAAAVAPK